VTALAGPRGAGPGWFAQAWRPVALAVFATWVLFVGAHHEPWFDEAQSWLIARDSDLWSLLAHRVRYEGTPGLWHVVLWLAIRAGLPYRLFFLVSAIFVVAGAAVVLWRAPFPAPLRVLLLTSYFFGYQLSVVARSYSLDVLLVTLAAWFFADRVERPVRYALAIGLIANTNAYSFLAGGVLAFELAWRLAAARRLDSRRGWVSLVIVATLCVLALLCAWQPADNAFLHAGAHANPLLTLVVYLCNAFVDHVAVWSPDRVETWDVFASIVLTLLLQRPVVTLILAGHDRALCFAVQGVLLLFAGFVYANLWHAGVFFLFWMFVLWVQWPNPLGASDRRQLVAAMAIILTLQSVQTVRTGLWDIDHVYSPGRPAARLVADWRSAHPRGRIDGYGDFAFEIQPWLPGNPFGNYHHGDPRMSYVRWDRNEPWMAGASNDGTQMDFWHAVLADRPDLIVASPINRNWAHGNRADLAPDACRAGYDVLAALPGTMIWRGRLTEDETLYLFERRTSGPCVVANARN
jgi:hypothetical protein